MTTRNPTSPDCARISSGGSMRVDSSITPFSATIAITRQTEQVPPADPGPTDHSQRAGTRCRPETSTRLMGIRQAMPRLVASIPNGRSKANDSVK